MACPTTWSLIREARRMAAISASSLIIRASSTGADPSTGATSGRASSTRMRNLLGQDLSIPNLPGATPAASSAAGSSLSVWRRSSKSSWGGMAKSSFA